MDRSISLQAAIDEIKEIYEWHDNVTEDRIIDHLKRLPSAQPETCDTCKHGYFEDEQCNNCRVRFTSHYERRTDER